jgi:prevent-host-death family protein
MKTASPVNIHDAKTQFSKLLAQVERGKEVVIARAGKPVAKLSPYTPPKLRIAPPGSMEGQGFWIAEDFDEPIDELFDCLKE